jgi:hypothetical protein
MTSTEPTASSEYPDAKAWRQHFAGREPPVMQGAVERLGYRMADALDAMQQDFNAAVLSVKSWMENSAHLLKRATEAEAALAQCREQLATEKALHAMTFKSCQDRADELAALQAENERYKAVVEAARNMRAKFIDGTLSYFEHGALHGALDTLPTQQTGA